VKVGSNPSTIALRVVGGDEKENPVPGSITGPPCSSGMYIRGPGLSWVVMSPAGLKPENNCAGEDQQQL
jgi:hypothetical protein